jgi:hypothetical protein
LKDYPAFLFLIKSDFNKFIGVFVDSKYESTEKMDFIVNDQRWAGKQAVN